MPARNTYNAVVEATGVIEVTLMCMSTTVYVNDA